MNSCIGLLSDSHGRVERTLEAARLLVKEGAGTLIHLGDVGSTGVLDSLAQARDEFEAGAVDVHVVFGNVDHELALLAARARELGITLDHPVGRMARGGKVLVFQHGHSRSDMDAALAAGAGYLCHGHTHVQRDERIGATRVINPGALHRASKHTVACLVIEADNLRVFTIG